MKTLSSAIALLMASGAHTAQAQGTNVSETASDDAAELETVEVIGQRMEPGNMVVSGEELMRQQASSLEDIFANQSSVAVGGGSVTAQKIYVRGFEDVMLNYTVDGAQSPGELYHHQGRVQIEPDFIETIELDAGAGVATNGAGALTGALRTTLKTAEDMLDPGRNFGAYARLTGIFNGENGDRESAALYGMLGESTGLIVGATRESRDEYEAGNGELQEATPYDHLRAFAKLDGRSGAHSWSVTAEGIDDEATTYERPNLTNFRGTYILSDQEMTRTTLAGNYGFDPMSDAIDLHATVYRNDTDFLVQRLNSDTYYGEGDFQSTGFDLRNTSLLGRHSITYGVDYRGDELDSGQNATPPFAWGRTLQDASVLGVYVQDNWAVTDAVTVSAGVRYDDYSLDGEGGVSDGVHLSDDGVSPNIGITWEVVDGLVLRALYAEAFRGVTIREAFFSGLYVHDGDLESEEADNLEFGISWENGPWYVAATVYEQNIENFIDAEFSGPVPVWGYWRNVGDAKVEGYEIETGWRADEFEASIGVWDADNSLNGEPLADANLGLGTSIGTTWRGNFTWYGFDNWYLGAQLRYVESEPNPISADAPDKESYLVARVFADWTPLDNLTLAVTVNNLFDEFYYDHATYTWLGPPTSDYVGYPSVGREFVVSAAYRF